MFTSKPVGFVNSPYKDVSNIPKGCGAKHEADGVLKILPEFEPGLTDIEGFSHLIVIWEFDRSGSFELLVTPPSDMLDGTPILDIKPYLSNIPSEKLRRGWLAAAEARQK